MCGICGVAGHGDEVRLEDARRMAAALGHRGPDDRDAWASAAGPGPGARVALGHRRLSIIDLSERGRQPMASADGVAVVSYNGEIYNFQALRRELEGRGREFRTGTDTEVLLEAYREWGETAWARLVGMFAFALWDAGRSTLLLVRDRLGIKPLLYQRRRGLLLFASEMGALRAHPAFGDQIDGAAVGRFLRFGYFTAPETIYEDTFRLLPGEMLRWREGEIELERWWTPWDPSTSHEAPGGEAAADPEAALEEVLREAVRDRLVADVPVGAFLSGGIDSSTVVALMREVSASPVKTFSIGFREADFDEAAHARAVAGHLGTEHEELRVGRGDAVEVARAMPDLYDEPFADPSAIPTVLVSRLARRHVTVALTGDGGDELFAGYSRYRRLRLLGLLFRAPSRVRMAVGRAMALPPHPGLRRYGEIAADADAARAADGLGWRLPRTAGNLLRHRRAEEPRSLYLETFAAAPGGLVEKCMVADLLTWLADDVLVKLDRASMSVGLEGRVPLLDHRVVAVARSLPFGALWRNGRPKAPLRRLLGRRVPARLTERPKRGFGFPLHGLLGPELVTWKQRYLTRDRLTEEGLLDAGAVVSLAARLDTRRPADARALWHLLCFERWFARHHRGETLG